MPDKDETLRARCPWAKNALDIAYHDHEWGKPLHDDARLFELLILEGMQAGLSWSIVLAKREAMRAAFDGFDPAIMAAYGEEKIAALLENSAIIRNRAKLRALAVNAAAFLRVQRAFGSFDRFIWSFTGHAPIINAFSDPAQIPTHSERSDRMSAALKKHGFKFVGTTICYAFMQAAGMVNDHMTWCAHR